MSFIVYLFDKYLCMSCQYQVLMTIMVYLLFSSYSTEPTIPLRPDSLDDGEIADVECSSESEVCSLC